MQVETSRLSEGDRKLDNEWVEIGEEEMEREQDTEEEILKWKQVKALREK